MDYESIDIVDFKKWYECFKFLLMLGFDLDKNTSRDLLCAINDVYEHYEDMLIKL